MHYRIAPSLLAADFADLGGAIEQINGAADLLHLDVMDGHFVPNLSFGMPVIEAIRTCTTLPFDCHLMVTNPTEHLGALKAAGADGVTMHWEALTDPSTAAGTARRLGLGFGLVISPQTPWEKLEPVAELCDLIVIMSVHPGFGGQGFMPEILPKVEAARRWVDNTGLAVDIEIDGGISEANLLRVRDAGANVFVAGTSIFSDPNPAAAIARFRRLLSQ